MVPDLTTQSSPELQTWRTLVLNRLLIVMTIAALPAIVLTIREAVYNPWQWPAALTFTAFYLGIAALAALRRLNFYLRAWGLLAMGYAAGALSFARGGLAGDGRLFLLALPLIALILVGIRAGLSSAIASTITYAAFTVTAHARWMAAWLVRPDNTLVLMDWVIGGVVFALALTALIALQWEFARFQRAVSAEKARLYEAADRLRMFNENILQSMEEGVLLEDAAGRITFANPKIAELLGYSHDELKNKSWTAIVAPECIAEVEREKDRHSHGERRRYETVLLNRHGLRVPVIVSSRPLFEGQRFAGAVSVLIDIIERKQAEQALREAYDQLERRVEERTAELSQANVALRQEIAERRRVEKALRESEERYRRLIETSPDAIVLTDPQDNIVLCNTQTAALLGTEGTDALLGTSIAEFIAPEERDLEMERAQQITEAGIIRNAEYHLVRKDGSRLVAEVNASVLLNSAGRPQGIINVIRDVTSRTQAEEALRQRNRELALLNLASQVLTSTLDLDQVIVTLLEEIRKLMDVAAASVWLTEPETNELVCWQATGPRSDVVRDWHLTPGQGIAGWVAQRGEHLIMSDMLGDERHYRLIDEQTGMPLRSNLTIPLRTKRGVIGTLQVMDTQVDRFSSADLTIIEPLAAAAAVAIENARLYEQAQRDAETKSILLREVNHRVTNNLTAIIGLLYTEQRHFPTEARTSYQSILKGMISRVQSLATVHSLLSRSEWSPLPLSELVTQVIHTFLQALPSKKWVSVDVSPSPVQVTPEQAHNLALIINELTTNTIKHALQDRRKTRITVRITLENDIVCLEFQDDGPGYPEEVLQLRRHSVGFDLVQNIVRKNLNGELCLYNNPGAVAVIRFRLEPQEANRNSSHPRPI